ncbi:hypothetical protein FRC02_002196 [Tulasnella sp. 418]|nr:hypothetical protein FRC02_002196 [Tulasnella sp. 418]
MKALFQRLQRNREPRDVTIGGAAYEKQPQTRPPPPVLPVLKGEDYSLFGAIDNKPASPLPASRPTSTLDKPLPAITPDFDDRRNTATTTTVVPSREPTQDLSRTHDSQRSKVSSTSIAPTPSQDSPNGGPKRVAFISPPPTPAALSNTRPLPVTDLNSPTFQPTPPTPTRTNTADSAATPKSKVSIDSTATTRLNTTLKPSASSTSVGGPKSANTPIHSTKHFNSFPPDLAVSYRAGTPYSHMSNAGRSAILAATSWTDSAEGDLISNLSSRERTRQEVLWEIVTSEERYVNELIKLKETFIDPLLHPFATSPLSNPNFGIPEANEDVIHFRSASPADSFDHLPIAARFLSSPAPGVPPSKTQQMPSSLRRTETPVIDDSFDSDDDPPRAASRAGGTASKSDLRARSRTGSSTGISKPLTGSKSPYGTRGPPAPSSKYGKQGGSTSVPWPARSHTSLPPPPRPTNASSTSLGRQSVLDGEKERDASYSTSTTLYDRKSTSTPANKGFRKLQKPPKIPEFESVPPHMLPEDLRKCLEVLEGSTLKGHMKLCTELRNRYNEQYPLVRSLADVFVENSHILEGYATYVLHLEKALEQINNVTSAPETNKKPKDQDAAEWQKVCRLFKRLEENAAEKGETGLAISLSKPFQRLLKYPLMFQNLLFHTDPSTFEYESTLQMVAEVETIVRSIEDEKIQKEERDRTRDVWARIDGLEKVRMLAIPKPSRVLIEEKSLLPSAASATSPTTSDGRRSTTPYTNGSSTPTPTKPPKSGRFKRLSEVLPGGSASGSSLSSSKNDLWLVAFNDVVLRCQRVGTTSLPFGVSAKEGKERGKFATSGRRSSQTKPRNLYKFVQIETWTIGGVAKPRAGMVSMEEARSGIISIEPIKSGDTDDEGDGNDSDDSDRKSKMSFSYWGADKITVDPHALAKAKAAAQIANMKNKAAVNAGMSGSASIKSASATARRVPQAFIRSESSNNAKFGHRLRSESDSPARSVVPVTRKPYTSSTQNASQVSTRHMEGASISSTRKPSGPGSITSMRSAMRAVSPLGGRRTERTHNQMTIPA